MNNLYPVLNKNFHLHITASDCHVFNIIRENTGTSTFGLKEFKQWKIQPLMSKYLTYCDGKTTHEDICQKLNVPFKFLIDKGVEYLINETNMLKFNAISTPCDKNLFITGSFESYNPLHVSIEITDYCNFRCKHCYVSSSPEKLTKRSYEDTIKLFDLLWDKGVKVIELTGGECTTHPNFKEILKYASNKFNLVAVITNGYIIGKDKSLAKYISNFKNVAIQVSLDGLQDYHDTFRNKKGAFTSAINAIKYLKEYGTIVRIATTVTNDNIDTIEDIFLLCKSLGADSFATSTVSDFGRAKCKSCPKGANEVRKKLVDSLSKYSNDSLFTANHLSIEAMLLNKDINCGAGWRTFAINGASGNVRICLFLNDNGIIGNIDNDTYESIFHKDKLNTFRNAPSPSILLDTCSSCEFNETCNGCIAKALEVAKTKNPNCKWIEKYKIKIK